MSGPETPLPWMGTVHVRRTAKSIVIEAYRQQGKYASLWWRRYVPADRPDLVRRGIESYLPGRWTIVIHADAQRYLDAAGTP